MKRSLALCALLLCFASPVSAQTASDAESQLAAGHAAQAVTTARSLIDEGTRVGADLAPLYRVLGLAAATAGDGDAAREAFTRWLALEPDGHLDRSLPDEVRSPFLEARGFWASSPQRLAATVALRENGTGIDLSVVDPASMVARVRAHVRVAGGAWSDVVRAPAASLSIDVAGLHAGVALDYVITFLDESGNRIWHEGTDDAPLHLGEQTHGGDVSTVTPPSDTAPPVVATADATGFHVGVVIASVIAVGAIVGAAMFHADRERLAGVYNGDGTGCTGTGSTRGEVCGPQHSAINTDQIAAGVLYGVGGAAAVVAIVLAVVAPSGSSTSQASFSCGAGPGTIGLSCGGTF